MEELKPCPFCGGKKIRVYGKENFRTCSPWVQCESCLASTSAEDTEKEAIEAWNRRESDVDTALKQPQNGILNQGLLIPSQNWLSYSRLSP